MSQIVDIIIPPSGHAGGSGYVAPSASGSSSINLSSTSIAATHDNVALLLNSFSPAATASFIDRVNTGSGDVAVPRLDSQDIQRAVLTGIGAATTAKTLLVAAGASATAPGVGWAVSAVFLVAAGAYTIVHISRARRIARELNSGYVLYIEHGDYSLIEDALLNGIESYRRNSQPWVPVGLHASSGVPIQGGPCKGKDHRGLSFHFYAPSVYQGQDGVRCYDAHGVRFPYPWNGYGAVASATSGIVASDLVRVGAHACLLAVWGKGVPMSYIDAFSQYIVRTWQAREYVSRRVGDLMRASRNSPVPPGYLPLADIMHHPNGVPGLSNTGWVDLYIASAAGSHAAAHQFGVLGVDRYWQDGNPVNSALLHSLYLLYSYSLYVGIPWDVMYRYLTGSIDSLPFFALSAPATPPRPPRPPVNPPPGGGPIDIGSGGQGAGASGSGGSRQFPWVAVLPTVALGLVLLGRRKRR